MPAIIAALWAALIPVLRTWLPSLVGRILLAFGIGLAVQTFAMPAILQMAVDYLDLLPDYWIQLFGALWIDIAFTMVMSAAAAQLASKVILRKLGT